VGEGNVLRLFAFRPTRSDAAFDAILRDEVLPGLLALPGLVEAFVGRRTSEPAPWPTRKRCSRIRSGHRSGLVPELGQEL
jgi:hypothetical protein